jgi:glycosyltransferase involved in cell wall biosynthesis
MPTKHLVLFDPHSTGHHPTYILIYVRLLLEIGHYVSVFFPDPDLFIELKRHYPERLITHRLQPFKVRRFRNKYLAFFFNGRRSWWLWFKTSWSAMVAKWQAGRKVDLVLIMMIDSYLHQTVNARLVDLFFRWPWIGLYFRPRSNSNRQWFGGQSALKSKRCLALLTTENLSLVKTFTDRPTYATPEITDENEGVDEELSALVSQRAKNRTVVGLLGNLAPVKGLAVFLELLARANSQKYFFLVAGPLPSVDLKHPALERMREVIDQPPENFLALAKKIPDGRPFNTLVKSCHIVYAVYEKFPHSSNVMTKAAIFEKYLIVSEGKDFLMARGVTTYNLGVAIPENSVSTALQALDCLSQGKSLTNQPLIPRFKEYAAEHSTKKLKEILTTITK